MSRYIIKIMHLYLPKRPTILNGGSILSNMHMYFSAHQGPRPDLLVSLGTGCILVVLALVAYLWFAPMFICCNFMGYVFSDDYTLL